MDRRLTLILLVALLLVPRAASAPAQDKAEGIFSVGVATRSFTAGTSYHWRGAQTHALVTTIWYPANSGAAEKPQWIGGANAPFASAGKAAPDALLATAPDRFPLVMLSHGTGASAPMMAWLGVALAAHGYIAAAVNHPGNNGAEAYTAQGFGLWWERARDLSVVIDQLLVDPAFGKRIDAQRIGGAGFSLGGYTMIEIAGGITEPSLYQDFCKSPRADNMCVPPAEFPALQAKLDEVSRTDREVQASLQHAGDSYRDPRVRAVFAIAPALGPAFKPESLAKTSIPVEIVAGAADSVVPPASSALFFASQIPHSTITLLPGVGHYTFLATCADLGRRARPDLCIDAAGVDRDATHSKTAALALAFFTDKLK